MKITRKDVDHVARLARLDLDEEEKNKFTSQLEAILGYIDKLGRVDTSRIAPTSHILGQKNVFREDVMKQCPETTLRKILENAPETESGFFKVKKVIE